MQQRYVALMGNMQPSDRLDEAMSALAELVGEGA
jgi:hypothetical protein